MVGKGEISGGTLLYNRRVLLSTEMARLLYLHTHHSTAAQGVSWLEIYYWRDSWKITAVPSLRELWMKDHVTSVIHPTLRGPHLQTHLGSKIPHPISKPFFFPPIGAILKEKMVWWITCPTLPLSHGLNWYSSTPFPTLYSEFPLPSHIVSVGLGGLPSGVSHILIWGQPERVSGNHSQARVPTLVYFMFQKQNCWCVLVHSLVPQVLLPAFLLYQ